MIKEILHPQIHYYRNAIENPGLFIKEIEEGNSELSRNSQIWPWEVWESSDKDRDYGQSKLCYFNIFRNRSDVDRSNAKNCAIVAHRAISAGESYAKDNSMNLGYLPDSFLIKKYYTEVSMGAHTDLAHGPGDESTISMVIYLNDDYVGGELEFPDFNISIKPEAGSIVVFESKNILHDPKPVTSGIKYLIPIFFFKR